MVNHRPMVRGARGKGSSPRDKSREQSAASAGGSYASSQHDEEQDRKTRAMNRKSFSSQDIVIGFLLVKSSSASLKRGERQLLEGVRGTLEIAVLRIDAREAERHFLLRTAELEKERREASQTFLAMMSREYSIALRLRHPCCTAGARRRLFAHNDRHYCCVFFVFRSFLFPTQMSFALHCTL